MNSIFTVQNLYRRFKVGSETINALKNINLIIESKKLTVFQGRSGSGKTTLLNQLGTLDQPDEGNILFGSIELTGMTEKEKNAIRREKVGFVYQSVALMPMMTAYENVELSLRTIRYPLKLRRERVEECLEKVGLSKRMHHMPGELSGGEQQRVAIARAMAHKPEVIFADEPTAELDTGMGHYIVKLLKSLTTDLGITVIMATHDKSLMDYADFLYLMKDGEVC